MIIAFGSLWKWKTQTPQRAGSILFRLERPPRVPPSSGRRGKHACVCVCVCVRVCVYARASVRVRARLCVGGVITERTLSICGSPSSSPPPFTWTLHHTRFFLSSAFFLLRGSRAPGSQQTFRTGIAVQALETSETGNRKSIFALCGDSIQKDQREVGSREGEERSRVLEKHH